jgi:hypothetical protein
MTDVALSRSTTSTATSASASAFAPGALPSSLCVLGRAGTRPVSLCKPSQ